MLTVGQVLEVIKTLPKHMIIRGYEGEISGIIIESTKKNEGYILHNDGRITVCPARSV